MPATFEEIVKGIGKAAWDSKLPQLNAPGQYLLEIARCVWKKTREQGEVLIVEFKVLESTNQNTAVGTSASWFRNFKYEDTAMSEVKRFQAAVLNKSRKEVDAVAGEILARMIGEDNPFMCAQVRCETFLGRNVKTGKDYCGYNWSAA